MYKELRPSIKQIIYFHDLHKKINGVYYKNNPDYNFSDMTYEDFKNELDGLIKMNNKTDRVCWLKGKYY